MGFLDNLYSENGEGGPIGSHAMDHVVGGDKIPTATPVTPGLMPVAAVLKLAQLDGMISEIADRADAQEALDQIQQLAIETQTILNTTQQSALEAQQAALAAQQAANDSQTAAIEAVSEATAGQANEIQSLRDDTDAIVASIGSHSESLVSILSSVTNLSRRIPSSMDVRDFVTGVLDDGNIDGVIDEARDAAYDLVNGVGLTGPGCMVQVPRGKWMLSTPHVFPAPGEYEIAVSLGGTGINETIFLAGPDVDASSVFTFGSFDAAPSPLPHTFYLRVKGFSVLASVDSNTKRNGITFYGPVVPVIEDIRIRGFRAPDATWNQGHAIRMMECQSDGQLVNSQFPVIRDCDIYGCMIGLVVAQAGPMTVENSHFQGCTLHNMVLDGYSGTVRNCGVQYGPDPDLSRPWGGLRNSAIVTGWFRTAGLPSGTGATCSASSAGLCTVTGLAGLLGAGDIGAAGHKSMWLELIPSGASANEVKVRGIYKIEAIPSPDTAIIRKASNHGIQVGLGYQVRCSIDNKIVFDNCYDEGEGDGPLFGLYASTQHVSTYMVRSCTQSTSGVALIEAQDCARLETQDNNMTNAPRFEARLRWVLQSNIDASRKRVDTDDYSYPGMICRSDWMADSAKLPSRTMIGMHDSLGGRSVRLRSALEEMGFVEAWDARVASSVTIASGNAQAMTGIINGTAFGPRHSGVYPQHIANDTEFEGPCIANLAGMDATGGSFRGVIPANKLPDIPYGCSIVLVARLESATIGPADPHRVSLTTPSGAHAIVLNDGQYYPGGGCYALSSGGGPGLYASPVDTLPHVWVAGRSTQGNNALSTDNGDDYARPGFIALQHAPGGDMTVVVGGDGVHTYALRWVLLAIKPGPLSPAEHRRVVDLARNEWRRIAR